MPMLWSQHEHLQEIHCLQDRGWLYSSRQMDRMGQAAGIDSEDTSSALHGDFPLDVLLPCNVGYAGLGAELEKNKKKQTTKKKSWH